jgi:cell division septation protein DedD
MIDIALHISKLLFTNDMIVVPGLGIFEIMLQETYHHPVNHEFAPKQKKISFVRDTTNQDQLLINSIKSPNAKVEVEKYISQLFDELKKNKEFYITNIGWLKLLTTGAIIFEQDKRFNYEKSYFGMESFILKPAEKKPEIKEIVKPVVEEKKPKTDFKISKPVVSKSKKVASETVVPPKLDTDKPKEIPKKEIQKTIVPQSSKKSSKKWLLLVAIGIASTLVVVLLLFKNKPETKVENLATNNTVENTDTLAKEEIDMNDKDTISSENDVVSNEEEVQGAEEIQAEAKKSENEELAKNNVAISKSNKSYYVIAGCFRSEKKAKEYLLDLKSSGYDDASIEGKTSGGLTRVCYAGFEKRSEANNYLDKISIKEGKDLWIQKIK